MSGILQKLVGWILGPILTWIGNLIAAALKKWMTMRNATKKIEESGLKLEEKVDSAKTKEEKDDAANEVIRDL